MKMLTRVNQFNRYNNAVAHKKKIQPHFLGERCFDPKQVNYYFRIYSCSIVLPNYSSKYSNVFQFLLKDSNIVRIEDAMEHVANIVKSDEQPSLKRLLAYRMLHLLVDTHDIPDDPQKQLNERKLQELDREDALYQGFEDATIQLLTEPNSAQKDRDSLQLFCRTVALKELVPYYKESIIGRLSAQFEDLVNDERIPKQLFPLIVSKFSKKKPVGFEKLEEQIRSKAEAANHIASEQSPNDVRAVRSSKVVGHRSRGKIPRGAETHWGEGKQQHEE